MRESVYATNRMARVQASSYDPRGSQHPTVRTLGEMALDPEQLFSVLRTVLRLQDLGVEVTPKVIEELARHAQNEPEREQASCLVPVHEPIVYYLRFSDRIKIGTSTNFAKRRASIPHDEVLGTEPGGVDVERARHQQFAAHRVLGEWFQSNPDLLLHIRDLPAMRDLG